MIKKQGRTVDVVKGDTSGEVSPFGIEPQKHAGGRPPLYDSPEKLQVRIDEYFESCWAERPMVGRVQIRPYTMAGLALSLGMCTQSLRNYDVKSEFFGIVKAAKQKVEIYVEEQLFEGKATGPIFWLKNHAGYTDKREVEHSGKLTLEEILGGDDDE